MEFTAHLQQAPHLLHLTYRLGGVSAWKTLCKHHVTLRLKRVETPDDPIYDGIPLCTDCRAAAGRLLLEEQDD